MMQILRERGDAAFARKIVAHKCHGANFVHFSMAIVFLWCHALRDCEAILDHRGTGPKSPAHSSRKADLDRTLT